MIASPSPVQEIAAVASSAQVPAAISGESPTRPGCLPALPPVEVAAATLPRASRATAPTVPPREASPAAKAQLALLGHEPRLGRGLEPGLACERRRPARRRASRGGPRRAPRAPPGPGCGSRASTATEPAARSSPRMIDASSVTNPCSLSAAPRPALNTASSSSTIVAACTAASASPPAASTACPASTARRTPSSARSCASAGHVARPAMDHDRDLAHARQDKGVRPFMFRVGVRGRRRRRSASTAW